MSAESGEAGPRAEPDSIAAFQARVAAVLVGGEDLSVTLHRCCEAMVDELDAAFARVWTLEERGDTLRLRASAGLYTHLDGAHSRVPVGQFKIGKIAAEREPHLTNSVLSDPLVSDPDWAREQGMRSFAGHPLIVDGRLVGVVAMFSRHELSPLVLDSLSIVARGIALGIEQREAVERLKLQTDLLERLQDLGRRISAELDVEALVQTVTDAATLLVGAELGAFFYNVLDSRGGKYMLYALSGVSAERFENLPMPRATGLFGPTFRGEATIRLDDVRLDPRFAKNEPHWGLPEGHVPVVSYLAVPVVSPRSGVIGGLFFGHAEPGRFSPQHAALVEALAAQTAVSMDNARLFETAQQQLRELDHSLDRERQARSEAEVASRAKDEFLSVLSHEIRTPLNAIVGWTKLLTSGRLDESKSRKALEAIERNAGLQGELIEDLLDVSRIVSGKLRLDVVEADLAKIVEEAVESVRPAAKARSIRIQRVLDSGATTIAGDPVRLQQILWNLLSNAVKFSSKGGRVQVVLEQVDSQVRITVADTGPGISEEALPFVFDRFRQADSSSARSHGGLGLGLAIVRHLVELHGGTVTATNRSAPETGAVFSIDLPVMPTRRPESVDSAKGPPVVGARPELAPSDVNAVALGLDDAPDLNGIRVLAVEDEPDGRMMLQTLLEECGAEVRVCASVAEGWKELEASRPDVLISDIGMPGEDGYALIERLRREESEHGGTRLPAVALTAYARTSDRLLALSRGFDMHVTKPVEPAELALVIASLARR